MLVRNMIDSYIEQIMATRDVVINEKEKEELSALSIVLDGARYLIDAIELDFDLDNAPSTAYLFDTKRNMFWKESRGYTRDILMARLYSMEEAKKIAKDDFDKDTKIVYFNY